MDVIATLNKQNRTLVTGNYYKTMNTHDYLPEANAHFIHKNNLPYNLRKQIVVFVTCPDKMNHRLRELKHGLRECHYPHNIVNEVFDHGNVITQGILSPFLSVNFFQFLNDSY